MQPVYDEDGTIKTVNSKIVAMERTGKMSLATDLVKGQSALKRCAAFGDCMQKFLVGITPQIPKPRIPSDTSSLNISVQVDSWFISNNNLATFLGNSAQYLEHANYCAIDKDVVRICS